MALMHYCSDSQLRDRILGDFHGLCATASQKQCCLLGEFGTASAKQWHTITSHQSESLHYVWSRRAERTEKR